MQIWEKEMNMEFNPTKCQVLHITKNKKTIKSKFYLQVLTSVQSAIVY